MELIELFQSSNNEVTMTMKRQVSAAAAMVVAGALLLTGCAEDGSAGEAGGAEGSGLSAGATKEEYIAAFEDVEPIELLLQSADTPEQSHGLNEYVEAVSEWSGGKVNIEMEYSAAVAPLPEVAAALADGRLDLAILLPQYTPAEFPAFMDAFNTTVLSDQDLIVG